jgi:hypothetical protein
MKPISMFFSALCVFGLLCRRLSIDSFGTTERIVTDEEYAMVSSDSVNRYFHFV